MPYYLQHRVVNDLRAAADRRARIVHRSHLGCQGIVVAGPAGRDFGFRR